MIKCILMDIEGTITSLSFVKDVLFPYSEKGMTNFLTDHQSEEWLYAVKKKVEDETQSTLSITELADLFCQYIREDRKHPGLKEVQGRQWQKGFESGDFKGHLYEDVPAQWKEWQSRGLTLAIYSSGSVQAQKLIVEYSVHGNLKSFIGHYFDTKVGSKREVQSFTTIANLLDLMPQEILFLSDILEELNAAMTAGMHTAQVLREGVIPQNLHPRGADLAAIHALFHL